MARSLQHYGYSFSTGIALPISHVFNPLNYRMASAQYLFKDVVRVFIDVQFETSG